MSGSDRRRLVRFAMLRQHLCPLCGNYICFNNKENVYKCKNEDCSYVFEKNNNSTLNNNIDLPATSKTKALDNSQELKPTMI